MLKMIAMLKRKSHLSQDEFMDHWVNIHAPLAFRVPGIRRYVQCLVQSEQVREDIKPMDFEIDGIAELWFDDAAALDLAHHTSEMRALLADGATFIGEIKTYFVHEFEVALASNST